MSVLSETDRHTEVEQDGTHVLLMPNGWFHAGFSEEFARGDLAIVKAFGEELVFEGPTSRRVIDSGYQNAVGGPTRRLYLVAESWGLAFDTIHDDGAFETRSIGTLLPRPVLRGGDGPVMQYRGWARQLYPGPRIPGA